ncbi:MAG: hypothetical protein ACRELY_22120 [Polyangiaceae bacterium]
MARLLAALLVLSLPLAGCASTGLLASAPAGGGSGGSPLAGSPDYSARAESRVSSASRDVSSSREASRGIMSTREPQIHEHIMCRNCR